MKDDIPYVMYTVKNEMRVYLFGAKVLTWHINKLALCYYGKGN